MHLDNMFGVVADEDTLTKELYTIKQGPRESVNCFDTCIGYVMMLLVATFPNAMPPERSEETKKSHFLGSLMPNLKAALAWELCLDGRGHNMTFRNLKMAAQRVEQRDNPEISDDPFVQDNMPATNPFHMDSQDDGRWDGNNRRNNNRWPQYAGYGHQTHRGGTQPTV